MMHNREFPKNPWASAPATEDSSSYDCNVFLLIALLGPESRECQLKITPQKKRDDIARRRNVSMYI